jgi:small basic protein
MIMDWIIETLRTVLVVEISQFFCFVSSFVAHSLIATTIALVYVGAPSSCVLQRSVCRFWGLWVFWTFCHIRAMYCVCSAGCHSLLTDKKFAVAALNVAPSAIHLDTFVE